MPKYDYLFKGIDIPGALVECQLSPRNFADKTVREAAVGDAGRSIAYLVILSAHSDKRYFNEAFDEVIKSGEDLGRFIGACRSGVVRNGLGRAVKNRAQEWLRRVSTEEILQHNEKFSEGKVSWGWFDFIRLLHPRPNNAYERSKFEYMSALSSAVSDGATRIAVGENDRIFSLSHELFLSSQEDRVSKKLQEMSDRLDDLEEDI